MSFRLSTLSLAAGVVVAALSAPAFAAEQQGWYLGGGAGYAKNTISNIDHPSDTSEKTSDIGFKMYGGYQFNKNWATEIELVSLGKYTRNYDDGGASVKTTGIGMSAIGMLPLSEKFGLFGKLGLISKYAEVQEYSDYDSDSESGSEKKVSTVALFGGGAQYHFMPNLTLRAEYVYYGKNSIVDNDVKITNSLFSLGMHYRF